MQNQMIRFGVYAETTAMTLAEKAQKVRERSTDEHGQAAAEYLGIILVVSVIIAIVATSGIGDDILKRIRELIGNIGKGESGKGG